MALASILFLPNCERTPVFLAPKNSNWKPNTRLDPTLPLPPPPPVASCLSLTLLPQDEVGDR